MAEQSMEYNTSRDNLIIPEYGRHVQGMIDFAKTIEDPGKRQAFVEKVVNLVVQMNAQNKNIDDFREKVWKHVFRIGEFELDVLPPSGHAPTREEMFKNPNAFPIRKNPSTIATTATMSRNWSKRPGRWKTPAKRMPSLM